MLTILHTMWTAWIELSKFHTANLNSSSCLLNLAATMWKVGRGFGRAQQRLLLMFVRPCQRVRLLMVGEMRMILGLPLLHLHLLPLYELSTAQEGQQCLELLLLAVVLPECGKLNMWRLMVLGVGEGEGDQQHPWSLEPNASSVVQTENSFVFVHAYRAFIYLQLRTFSSSQCIQ